MEIILKAEDRFKSFIGYFYAMIATVFCSFHPIFNKALKHRPVAEVNIYRMLTMFIFSYLVVKNEKGTDGYCVYHWKLESLLWIRSFAGTLAALVGVYAWMTLPLGNVATIL